MTVDVEKVKKWIISLIALHIYGVNAKLLYYANPDRPDIEGFVYSFVPKSEAVITTQVFAFVYAVATAGILFIYSGHSWRWRAVLTFACLDGFGMFVYYKYNMDKSIFIWFSSIYYAIYTVFIFVFVGLHKKEGTPEQIETINTMRDVGATNEQIAEVLKMPVRLVKKI
jgi:hypothetical protein